ncbi:hypothetical protein IFM89_030184 [Coptis chinensis]|uniref:Disease resistance protein n=1 Tax=Coptis chinensis TaxID=261450 RepID=A0A835LFK9_9MAGN|nr:hypothetical protein IFM89_030184 [Coptis chinensis]
MSTSTVEKAPDDAFCNLEVLKLRFMHSLGTFHKLKVLSVRNSYKLIELITRDLLGRLQNLEQLRPKFCFNLKTIIQLEGDYDTAGEDIRTQSPNLPPSPAFLHLKCLIIQYCYTLKCLVPMKVKDGEGGRYKKIEYLRVTWCWALQNIIQLEGEDELVHTASTQSNITHLPSSPIFPDLRSDNNADEDKAILPLLEALSIKDLPKLSRFTERDSFVFDWPSLEILRVEQCEKLKRLPLDTDSAPKLRKFKTDWKWFEGLE